MKKALYYLFIFVAFQFFGGTAVNLLWKFVTGNADVTAAELITSTVVCSVLIITVFLWTRWTEVSPRWLRTRQWAVLFWSVVASLGALVPSMWLQENMPELPNVVENEFDMLLTNRWGYFTIGLLAPLSEEIVFRGAILRSLLRSPRISPWVAICISAVFFALIHMNPAQMPHAFLVGLLLGWMYKRTGSILPGVAYHWANNSVAYIFYNIYPNPDMKLVDLFKGSEQHVLLAVAFSLLILAPALYQLYQWMRPAEEVKSEKR